MLKKILTKMNLISLNEHKELVQTAYVNGFNEGREKGQNDGLSTGMRHGYNHGLNDGRIENTYRKLAYKGPFSLPHSNDLFKLGDLPINKEDAKKKLRLGIKDEPNDQQWEMILSEKHNTYVVAGAGSGKSTSLINRIIVLDQCMGFPRSSITAFTFTRESREDLIKKLLKAYKVYGEPIQRKEAEDIIRTFHSKIYQTAASIGIAGGKRKLFEFHGRQEASEVEQYGMDDFYGATNLKNEQINILQTAYRNAFNGNKHFKDLIIDLLKRSLKKTFSGDENQYNNCKQWEEYAHRDKQLAEFLPIALNNPSDFNSTIEFQPIEWRSDLSFFANGYSRALGFYVVFVPDNYLLLPEYEKLYHLQKYENNTPWDQYKEKSSLLVRDTRVRERFLAFYSKKPIAFICDQESLDKFRALDKWAGDYIEKDTTDPPQFEYILEGEIKPNPIYLAFYSSAQFIESMGLEVSHIEKHIAKGKLSEDDKVFVKALIIFWEYFQKELESKGLIRFHNLFVFFSETNQENFKFLPQGTLTSMTHILIDEFQDISPELVMWLRGVLTAQKEEDKHASLMCVGDDWQAVYGWRGSAPRYFLKYEEEFKSQNTKRLSMTVNYRCHQEIIEKAEKAIAAIKSGQRTDKAGVSAKEDHDFYILEFKHENGIRELCESLSKKIDITILESSQANIGQLYNILRQPDLLDRITDGGILMLPTDILELKEQTNHLRIKPFNNLQKHETQLLIKLNRLLLETLYPKETPLMTSRAINKPLLEIKKYENYKEIKAKINEILTPISPKEKELILLILTRTRRQQKPFEEYKNKYPNAVKILTYHSSKGLQAPYCVLVGDCFYKGKADFKNLVYSLAAYNQSYDDAQRDEARRLAYVALTRAEEKCYWYADAKVGGTIDIVDT